MYFNFHTSGWNVFSCCSPILSVSTNFEEKREREHLGFQLFARKKNNWERSRQHLLSNLITQNLLSESNLREPYYNSHEEQLCLFASTYLPQITVFAVASENDALWLKARPVWQNETSPPTSPPTGCFPRQQDFVFQKRQVWRGH